MKSKSKKQSRMGGIYSKIGTIDDYNIIENILQIFI